MLTECVVAPLSRSSRKKSANVGERNCTGLYVMDWSRIQLLAGAAFWFLGGWLSRVVQLNAHVIWIGFLAAGLVPLQAPEEVTESASEQPNGDGRPRGVIVEKPTTAGQRLADCMLAPLFGRAVAPRDSADSSALRSGAMALAVCITFLCFGLSVDLQFRVLLTSVEKQYARGDILVDGIRSMWGTLKFFFWLTPPLDLTLLHMRAECCLVFLLVSYHTLEFAFVSICHPSAVHWDSFLLNVGVPYNAAVLAGVVESRCRLWALKALPLGAIFSDRKVELLKMFLAVVSTIGFITSLIGLLVRSLALFTAGPSFTHKIATRRTDSHQVVDRGIYSFMRHPGYLGWSLWSIGSQVLLMNVASLAAYIILVYRFFSVRIPYEESYLLFLFEDDYFAYACRTPLWMPITPLIPHTPCRGHLGMDEVRERKESERDVHSAATHFPRHRSGRMATSTRSKGVEG